MKGKVMWIVAMFVVPVAANDNDNVEVLQLSANEKQGESLYATTGLFDVNMTAEEYQQRTWFVCQVNKTQARSEEERLAGIVTFNSVRCTPEMNFGLQLCCNRYEAEDFSQVGGLSFDTEQDDDDFGGGDLHYRICSQAVNGEAIAVHDLVNMPIECDSTRISPDQLKGNNDLQPGEIVLRQRLLYFEAMQIPMAAVPRCENVAGECGDGRNKTVVNPLWVDGNLESEGAPTPTASLLKKKKRPPPGYSYHRRRGMVPASFSHR